MLAKFIFYAKTRDPFERRSIGLLSYLVINLNDAILLDFICAQIPRHGYPQDVSVM